MARYGLVLGLLVLAVPVAAQEMVIAVPLERTVFVWDHPLDPAAAAADGITWVFQCTGLAAPIRVPASELQRHEVPVSRVVGSPGQYTCDLRAENAFGVSDASNAVTFRAGYPPAPAVNLRLVVQ
ncbi:MAG: hypothetical protein QN130_12415 [Armatimonadota bacterium]|nr:hypothetical protein [Armatimonadota bacterium]